MWKIKNIYEADRTSSVLAHCEQCAVTLLRESCEGASHDCAHGCEERQPGAKLKALVELNQQLIKTPVVRNGKQATVGYQPDVWKGWN